jgi:hypothetical protein
LSGQSAELAAARRVASTKPTAPSASGNGCAKPQPAAKWKPPTSAKVPARQNKLESTLQRLLAVTPAKLRVDASYLLEHDKRTRKRPALKNQE